MKRMILGVALLALAAQGAPAKAQLKLDQYYTSNAVLQRGTVIPVSGLAAPGAPVTVSLGSAKAEAQADAKGRWTAALPAQQAGGPLTLVVKAGTESLTATNILIGEVWLVSGQSNAYFPIERFAQKAEWLKDADYPRIHFMEITWQPPHMRRPDQWNVLTAKTAAKCSATGFFFARALQREMKVPVGIVVAAADGSTIQKWISEEAIRKVPGMPESMARQAEAEKRWNEYWVEVNRRKKLPAEEVKKLGELKRPPYPARYYSDLFDHYIEPMVSFPFKGVIWYQGESNGMFAQGYAYRRYLQEMIRDWRQRWNRPLPFLIVQLPHYNKSAIWGDLRDSQNWVASQEKDILIVPTFDIGDMKNIHPPRKPELGERLSVFARKYVYGEKALKPEGPIFESAEQKGGELLVRFRTNAPIVSRDGQPLRGFQVAGKEGNFWAASVRIVDDRTLAVSNGRVKEPVAVRYGWDSPDEVNFFDKEGRVGGAFRSDTFKLPTQH